MSLVFTYLMSMLDRARMIPSPPPVLEQFMIPSSTGWVQSMKRLIWFFLPNFFTALPFPLSCCCSLGFLTGFSDGTVTHGASLKSAKPEIGRSSPLSYVCLRGHLPSSRYTRYQPPCHVRPPHFFNLFGSYLVNWGCCPTVESFPDPLPPLYPERQTTPE